MKPKTLLFLSLFLITTLSAFAVDMSAGLGANFAANYDSYGYVDDDGGMLRTLGGGVYAFFDAAYAEANIGMLFGAMKHRYYGLWSGGTYKLSYLLFGLYGKYPFDINGFSLIPMLGVQFDLGLGAKHEGADLFGDSRGRADFMNRVWVKFGAGADFNLTERLSLRPSFLYGINFGTASEREHIDDDRHLGSYNHGFDVRAAIAYRLKK